VYVLYKTINKPRVACSAAPPPSTTALEVTLLNIYRPHTILRIAMQS
jgi:hypothetical protein